MDSAWCRHEVDEARAYGIPIICVVDVDRQTQREVIDCYMEKDFGWLFDSQASCFLTSFEHADFSRTKRLFHSAAKAATMPSI